MSKRKLTRMIRCKKLLTLNHKLKTYFKDKNTMEYLGCTMIDFIKHIEKQFEEGMSWDNYGRVENVRCWHLDHKVPAFYKENEDDEIEEVGLIEDDRLVIVKLRYKFSLSHEVRLNDR